MTKAQLRDQLIAIIRRASERGPGGVVPTDAQAGEVLDALVASDSAAEWDCVLFGRDQLAVVIAHYRAL